ncbi:universal stress protein [Hymenobacter lapidiphilus]|uniref:Universal stress protein n=1 Tax=Hymenobacter lapidiphilus TaxID=2608003 RepID=A0A7Y7PQZ9_9BACT|nr:universal stress protein [Hymenobacter lapidiphilus]NVO32454.1 universal stress protein [Hymenobacter lapidiphilus]
MQPCFVVFVDLSAGAARAAHYAALLGAPRQVRLELVNVCQAPMLSSELAFVPMPYVDRLQTEADAALQELAEGLPTAAGASVLMPPLADAVQQAITRFHPLLLAMGLSAEPDLLDQLLHNQALPVLRATHRPLLLVPEAGPPPEMPRRVLVAVDGEHFILGEAALALAPLLASWKATFSVVHVRPALDGAAEQADQYTRVGEPLRQLLPLATAPQLYNDDDPAATILRARAELQADLLILIARPRSFLGRLFHHSVTAQVLRGCAVPVLLLPAHGPGVPDWMPSMS